MEKFEGPEKKLEIVLFAPQTGLRNNTDGRWDRVVRASGAEILKRESVDKLDSYLLSESSLFVWDDRILIITCGRTTPVCALPIILEYVEKDRVAFLIYKRKNLNFPAEQPTNFEQDRAYLSRYFAGRTIRLGPAIRDHIHVFYYANSHKAPSADACLRVLMHDIDPAVGKIFFQHAKTRNAFKNETLSRLTELYPAMVIDNHFFYPQGYSLNGISEKGYYTIHITPQRQGSYASFETNVIERDYSRVIGEIISIFNPHRFSLVLTSSRNGRCVSLHNSLADQPPDYQVSDSMQYEFDHNYITSFSNYLKQF
jgi:S-adenosylmethionine decarboxylase